MPGKRGYRRRPMRRRRRTFRRKRRRHRRLRPEVKHIDSGTVEPTHTTSNDTFFLFGVSEGAGINSRVGRKITPISLVIRGTVVQSDTATGDHESVRLVVVQDKQQLADSYPTPSLVFENITDPYAFRQHVRQGQFRILAQRTYLFHKITGGKDAFKFRIALNLPPMTIFWNGANVTDVQKNGIYFMLMSDATSGAPVTVDWRCRARYIDV